MANNPHPAADVWAVTKTCILAFIALVGILIILTSVAYFPPTFDFGFLKGREAYFYSWYAVAFYIHVISSPITLFLGMVQSVSWVRKRHLRLHRALGKAYVLVVLLLAAPSGLAMSIKADRDSLAVVGFATLAVATEVATWLGFVAAKRGSIAKHQQWMTRSYLLICSAVLLRFIAALTNQFELGLTYGAMAWLSWVPSLVVYEVVLAAQRVSAAGK
ncbi:MAG: DUF2306 domain-containing protein [Pirellulaceae bacterium]|nr:DUF2306 domain-containing protein [Pirellulaceae bacterium]